MLYGDYIKLLTFYDKELSDLKVIWKKIIKSFPRRIKIVLISMLILLSSSFFIFYQKPTIVVSYCLLFIFLSLYFRNAIESLRINFRIEGATFKTYYDSLMSLKLKILDEYFSNHNLTLNQMEKLGKIVKKEIKELERTKILSVVKEIFKNTPIVTLLGLIISPIIALSVNDKVVPIVKELSIKELSLLIVIVALIVWLLVMFFISTIYAIRPFYLPRLSKLREIKRLLEYTILDMKERR